jgi:hypothetical protein
MYKIFADDTLIYDSTLDDYKIGKGVITLEVNKSGSFSFSIYPDHFYYDDFVRLKTVITVYKSDKIVFRGRILNDVTDYWNNKNITCEGELGFLQDSIIRPFSFNGTPEDLFKKFIEEHNSQVDDFKKFKVGAVTVVDDNNYIARSNSEYESTFSNLNSRLLEGTLGGYFYITHGDNGTDPVPTINYLADFTKVSSQKIEFGANLKNYTKTVKADEIATAIIPLGATIGDVSDGEKLTIKDVNNGVDYVYSTAGVALYGWIFKVVEWSDVTVASRLKTKALDYVENVVKQNITIELTAVDLHLIDPDIESINVCEYVQAVSDPHNLDITLLCNKQTIDLLKPDNDSFVLGYTYTSFTEKANQIAPNVTNIVNQTVNKVNANVNKVNENVALVEKKVDAAVVDIKKNTDGLSSKVSKNEVISEINQSPEEVKISAEKINIKGAVTFESLNNAVQNTIRLARGTAEDALISADSAKEIADTAEQTANNAKSSADSANSNINEVKNNIYKENTTLIDGGKIYTNSVSADAIKVDELFAKDIHLTGSFTTTTTAILNITMQECEVIQKHLLYEFNDPEGVPIPESDIPLYDFNKDGVIDLEDLTQARRYYNGKDDITTWEKIKPSTVTLTIDLSNPTKAIRCSGVNTWGHTVETFFGITANWLDKNDVTSFNDLLERSGLYTATLSSTFKIENYSYDTTYGNSEIYSADINVNVKFRKKFDGTPRVLLNAADSSSGIINVIPLEWSPTGITKIRVYRVSSNLVASDTIHYFANREYLADS